MSPGKISKAYLVPGLPHLVFGKKLQAWTELVRGYEQAGDNCRKSKPDVLVTYSTQWISVLGHSFQTHPNPSGIHVDENWYDLGDLPFSAKVDVDLTKQMASKAAGKGLATKLINFDGFPLDTGTIVAQHFLNADGSVPVAVLSSNVYANAADSMKLGAAVSEAIQESGRNAVLVACTGMSGRFHTTEIDFKKDEFSNAADDEWNRRLLKMMEAGKCGEVLDVMGDFAANTMADMQFKAFAWLMGALGVAKARGKVLAYGPIYGTGAAVVEFDNAS
jgi:2-aminophenol/2-amino-5-chlorophenol 1,6-dioxygenase alpha subunit